MSLFSLEFIAFAGVLTLVYFLVPKKCQWVVLLVASFGFYLTGGLEGIYFILITCATIYVLGLLLQRQNDAITQALEGVKGAKAKKEVRARFAGRKKLLVWIAVLVNLGILCFHKFANPFIETWNDLFGAGFNSFDLIVPLGLSYYTFKSIGYVIDVYRGREDAERNPLKLALYVSFFPALFQGPIDRYEHLAHQLFEGHAFSYERCCFGAQRMLWGYIKKMVIADRIALFTGEVLGNYATEGYAGFLLIVAVVLYSFQLYADFSGGIDIVCGLSEIFGISLTENFRQPFFAKSVSEYWQRWHISLGNWMRTYVFYPLSLSPRMTKLGKWVRSHFGEKAKHTSRVLAPAIASFVTFILVGIWHGTGWQYVWWGFFLAIFVSTDTLFEEVYRSTRAKLHISDDAIGLRIFQVVRTFAIITALRFVTLAGDMQETATMLGLAFGRLDPTVLTDGTLFTLGLDEAEFWVMLIGIAAIIVVDVLHERGVHIRLAIARQNIVVRWTIYYAAIFILAIFGVYGLGAEGTTGFIYQNY